jgi:hypothetical protein
MSSTRLFNPQSKMLLQRCHPERSEGPDTKKNGIFALVYLHLRTFFVSSDPSPEVSGSG